MLRCRGMALSASRAWIRERAGPRGWDRVRRRVRPPDVRAALDGIILTSAWYDATLLAELLDAASDLLATPGAARALGARVAATDLAAHLAGLARPGTGALTAAPRIFEEYWSHGRLVVIERRRRAVELALDNPGFPEILCRDVMLGWGEHALVRSGARVLRNEHVACVRRGDAVCVYRAAWSG